MDNIETRIPETPEDEKKQDLRVIKTHQAIRRAFEELLMEMEYPKITVKMLCERAMINRKTFYAHYAYLDLLLDEYIAELADGYLREVGTSCGLVNLPERIRRFFLFAPKVPPLVEKIMLSCDKIRFFARMSGFIQEKSPCELCGIENADPASQNIIVEYLNNACFTIYRSWLSGGKKLPAEDLAELGVTLVCGGLTDLLAYIGK